MTVVKQLPAQVDLQFVRGDDFSQRLFFYRLDNDGVTRIAEDVSSWGFTAQLRRTRDAVTAIDFSIATGDAADGYIDIALAAAVTATLPEESRWDLQRVVEGLTLTVLAGKVIADRDVTRSD